MELKKFNENVSIKDKDNKLAEYKDDEGNINIFPINYLICKCEHFKFDKNNKVILEFQKEIPTNIKFNKVKITTQISKSEITGKEEDKYTLVDRTIMVYEAWRVTNGLGFKEVFNNKEEAINYCEEINNKYIKLI